MNMATKSEAKYILYDYYFRKSRAKGRGRVCAREGCRQGMCGEIINIYGPLGKQWPVKKNHPNINYHEIHLG